MFKLTNIKKKTNIGIFKTEDQALQALVEEFIKIAVKEYRIRKVEKEPNKT